MQRYDSYKDSGIQWLGEIPSHWEVVPLKYCMILNNGRDYKEYESNNGIPVIGTGGQFAYSNKEMFNGEVVFFGRKGTIDKPFHYKGAFWAVDTVFYAEAKSNMICRYLYYLGTTIPYGLYSTSTAIPSMTQTDLLNNPISLPPLPEQQAIASYLDTATAKIDEAIAQQQKMIDLLNERKQIIINNAVTKGLNPNAPMKPSGIDWIGQIPEHWEVKRGKFLFSIINDYSTTGEEELLTVSDRTGITPRSMKNVTMFMSESLVGYKKCKVGDICSNIMWMWHGAVGVTQYNGVISPSYGVYRQKANNYDSEYLDMMLRLPRLVKLYASLSTGLTESRLRLYPDDFMNISFFIPPIDEQKQIVDSLKSICLPIDNAISNATKQITLLQERKQIIINDVVTGKVKVS